MSGPGVGGLGFVPVSPCSAVLNLFSFPTTDALVAVVTEAPVHFLLTVLEFLI